MAKRSCSCSMAWAEDEGEVRRARLLGLSFGGDEWRTRFFEALGGELGRSAEESHARLGATIAGGRLSTDVLGLGFCSVLDGSSWAFSVMRRDDQT